MGISRANGALALIQDVIRSEKLVVVGLKMAELGNQSLRKDVLGVQVPAKAFFAAMGILHTSLDINGKDGSLPVDLRLPITQPELLECFDIVTNFGTIQEIERQHTAWQNVHRLAKVGGLMLHLVPQAGSWKGKFPLGFGEEFFPALAQCCSYDLLKFDRCESDPESKLFAAVLRKKSREFPAEAEFFSKVRIDGLAAQ
ncbi:MAG: hypothetical protein AAB074_16235 [Planctomycetota bacterium]